LAGVYATKLPLNAQLIAHELPADFLEDLTADKAAFQSTSAERAHTIGDHIANNPGKLTEWTAATHIERAPRHKTKTPPSAGSPTPVMPSGT
jgi:hypothetical protein